MGQFSWITQDTHQSIREKYDCDEERLTIAYLHDNKGNVWEEKKYEGYGRFGGKDFYQLLAEMNNVEGLTGDVDKDRDKGINLYYGSVAFISPNLTRNKEWKWVNRAPEDDPNQGWGEEEEEDIYELLNPWGY